jgi:hypothetical protein
MCAHSDFLEIEDYLVRTGDRQAFAGAGATNVEEPAVPFFNERQASSLSATRKHVLQHCIRLGSPAFSDTGLRRLRIEAHLLELLVGVARALPTTGRQRSSQWRHPLLTLVRL